MASATLVTRDIIAAFSERIVASLLRRPLELEASEHRERIGVLVGQVGSLNHYQLLEIDVVATAAAVADGYENLARVVSPVHAGRLGLENCRGTLELLFERATEAYLVLSDPDRRAAYDRIEGIDLAVPRSEAELAEERRTQAAALHTRAQGCMRAADFHFAVELLKEATRLDSQAEYHALLGEAQSKNPHWNKHAIESYAKAVSLDFSQTPWMLRHAQLLEVEGRFEESRKRFEEVLERQPDHPEALAGVARIASGGAEPSAKPGEPGRGLLDTVLGWFGLRRAES